MVAAPTTPEFSREKVRPPASRPRSAKRLTREYPTVALDDADRRAIVRLPLRQLQPSPWNPRQRYDDAGLQALANSLLEHGQIAPIVVRPLAQSKAGNGPQWQIVAGHRRYYAAKRAQIDTLDCVIRRVKTPADHLTLALTENLQREDLSPIEEATAFAALLAAGSTQRQIARDVGRSEPAISNALRLLRLPQAVQTQIDTGELSAAHGRALIGYQDRLTDHGHTTDTASSVVTALAANTARQGTTSKALERLVNHASASGAEIPHLSPAPAPPTDTPDPTPPPARITRAQQAATPDLPEIPLDDDQPETTSAGCLADRPDQPPAISVANVAAGLIPGATLACPHCHGQIDLAGWTPPTAAAQETAR